MRIALAVAALLLAFPATASADVIFDPADADELAAALEEAAEGQDVCYGWDVTVDDGALATRDESVGSNFGAGQSLSSAGDSCRTRVEFRAFITYTSETSEAEDSATYDVVSTPSGPTTADLNDLELGLDGLAGENPDVVVAKAVAALPLLAADAGVADPIEASPAPESEAADARLTDSPDSDFWRGNGGTVLWGGGLLLAGGLFAWWVLRSSRRYKRYYAPVEQIPAYVPDTVPDDLLEEPWRDAGTAKAETKRTRQPAAEAKPAAEPPPEPDGAESEPASSEAEPAGEDKPATGARPVAGRKPDAAGEADSAAAGTEPGPEPAAEPAPEPEAATERDAATKSDAGPSSGAEPTAGTEPVTGTGLSAGTGLAAGAEPAAGAKPAAEVESAAGAKPAAEAEPANEAKPATEGEPPPPSTRAPESTSDKDKE